MIQLKIGLEAQNSEPGKNKLSSENSPKRNRTQIQDLRNFDILGMDAKSIVQHYDIPRQYFGQSGILLMINTIIMFKNSIAIKTKFHY